MRMVVVLPAPLGPRKPKTSPTSTPKESPSRARREPYSFERSLVSTILMALPAPRTLRGRELPPERQPGPDQSRYDQRQGKYGCSGGREVAVRGVQEHPQDDQHRRTQVIDPSAHDPLLSPGDEAPCLYRAFVPWCPFPFIRLKMRI
jgi:hypothetical protein